MNEKPIAQTPEEMMQAASPLAEKLDEMDMAEGIFSEISDEQLDEIAGGAILPVTVPGSFKCAVCNQSVDPLKTYAECPNSKPAKSCPYVNTDRS
jgi:hypothetical protein